MITTNHSPFDNRIFYKEALSLKKAGYSVTVIGQTDHPLATHKENIRIIGITKTKVKIINDIFLIGKLLHASLKIDCDVYHCHEPNSFIVALFHKLFRHKTIVYDVHEYYEDLFQTTSLQMRVFLGFMLYIIEPLFCRFCDAIITVDEGISERYIRFSKNVRVISNFPPKSRCGDISFAKRNISNSEGFTVIYVGGMAYERGIFSLIEAIKVVASSLPSIKLVLVGNFESKSFQERCIEYIKLNDIENNVELLGYVPHTRVPRYISAADVGMVLLYPTERYSKTPYPVKLFEYMICEKPVIASNLPAMGKIIRDSKCGLLVDPKNIDEIARAIMYIYQNRSIAQEMGLNGKKAVGEKYNWSIMEKKLLEVYGGCSK